MAYEQKRTQLLEKSGYKILRFYNSDINKKIKNVEHTLMGVCDERVKELNCDIEITFTE